MAHCVVIIDLHCDPTIPSGAGDLAGGNTYSRDLLLQLMKTQYKHIFITRKKYPYLEEYIKLSDYSDFYRIDLGDFGPIDKDELQKYHSVSLVEIEKILAKYRDFKFIFHSSYWQSGMLALELSKKYNSFYVHTILSNAKKKDVLNASSDNVPGRIESEELVFRNAKYLICSSLSEVNDMKILYGINESRLLLTGLPIHQTYGSPAYTASGAVAMNTLKNQAIKLQYLTYPQPCVSNDYSWWNQKSYVYFGRMHENKGIKQIIMAWIQLAEEIGADVPPLWIIGGAPAIIETFRNTIKNEILLLEKYELRHKIIWWGALPPQGISTLLLKALVVITHSKYEAGGLVAIEAMRQGVPVIGTPNGYVNDYVKNWHNGFVVNYDDINNLSERMRLFYNQPYLSSFLGENAHNVATTLENSWDFFGCHLFAYGLKPLKSNKAYMLNEKAATYYSINHSSINVYPYLNQSLTSEKIKELVHCNLGIENCTVLKRDCSGDDYDSWEIYSDNKKLKLIYLYDIIKESEIWNPSNTPSYIITKSQRVINYVTAESAGLCNSILFHSTRHGIIIMDITLGNIFDNIQSLLAKLQPRMPSDSYLYTTRYMLLTQCTQLLTNIARHKAKNEYIEHLYNELNCLIQCIPDDNAESNYIGLIHSKDSMTISNTKKITLPCDKTTLSEKEEIHAYVVYNYAKKSSADMDAIIGMLNLCDEAKMRIKNWCNYFRIYDKFEEYYVTT